jgi:hypothetical protein
VEGREDLIGRLALPQQSRTEVFQMTDHVHEHRQPSEGTTPAAPSLLTMAASRSRGARI